ncbi:hypothetical protein ABOM_003485 [Aspergillus bombycis]|uniref:Large ribosomal subunit protein eL24-related N-terminal domain-containing protein n=1 Tax=Aspergillus bombycis TaxID=109264 RepID=A0A1F8A9G3_9EURO|nr:hypothetical protein ABOM_003485 [Aspergillus bombycis]OGM48372.1 hypothetical protein ABOM_003485 [Aspergillus bombycis]
MKSKVKGKSKGKGKSKLKKDHTNNKDNICITASNETITEINPDRVSAEIETAFRIEDDTLDQPPLPKNEDTNAETTVKQGETNTNSNEEPPRVGSLKRRLKMTFTGNPLKLPGDSDRHSCQIHSQDKATRSERSGSSAASLTDSNTTGTHGSIHSPTTKSPTTPPTPKFLKYVRATNDYMFLDLDFLETDTSNRVIRGGSLSSMEDTKQQAPRVSPSGKNSPVGGDHDTKKGLQKQVGRSQNARQILGNPAIGTIDMGVNQLATEGTPEKPLISRGSAPHHNCVSVSRTARRSDRYDSTTQRQPTTSRCASPTFKMRTYDDSFSGQKIYPGKGKLYVRGDSKIFRFQNGKSESLFLQRKNPRRISWTVLYRRQHKKGISEEVAKKRTRRAVKSQRAIVGASLDVIKERRNQRPEARAAARQQAIKEAKEKKAASEKAKKAKNAAAGKGTAQRIQSKQGAKGSAPKVAAKSR